MKSVSINKNKSGNQLVNTTPISSQVLNKVSISNSNKLYIYNNLHKLVNITTVKDYSVKVNKTASNIINIAKSFKGYGFDNDHFISLTPIERFLTSEEVMKLFNKWLIKGYDRNLVKLKGMYKTKFNEEYYSLAMLYVVEAIKSERSVNDFEQSLIYKYRTSMLDCERAYKLRHDNGLSSDFSISSAAGGRAGFNLHSNNIDISDVSLFIETMAEEGDSIFDTKKNYDCVEDYNSIKRFDVIGYILKETFGSQQVDIFVDVLQSEYDFTSIETIPDFKYNTLIRKYKDQIHTLKTNTKGFSVIHNKDFSKLSNTSFFKFIINECWHVFVNNIDRIRIESDRHTFKSIDNYGLYEIINN